MTEEVENGLSRRTVLQGAAWSVPIVAVAATAPMASASIDNANVLWVGGSSQLLALYLLNEGQSPVAASLLPSAPQTFQIDNGPGALTNLTAVFTVRQTTGLDIGVGVGDAYLHGFAPRSATPTGARISGPSYTNVAVGATVLGTLYGQETVTTLELPDLDSDETLNFSLLWDLTPRQGAAPLASIGLAVTFTVTVNIFSGTELVGSLSGANIQTLAGVNLL